MRTEKAPLESSINISLDKNKRLRDYVNNNPELSNLYELLSNIPIKSSKILSLVFTLDKIVDTNNINEKTNKGLSGLKKELKVA